MVNVKRSRAGMDDGLDFDSDARRGTGPIVDSSTGSSIPVSFSHPHIPVDHFIFLSSSYK